MRYKFSVGQSVKVKVKHDPYYDKVARIVEQHHGRNVLEFPNGDRADYIDAELQSA